MQTINLDNSFALLRRLRAEKRRQLQLREEILRVRGERESIALRMDEVRKQHERDSEITSQRNVLNNSLHDIELAISRGKENNHHEHGEKKTIDLATVELQLNRVGELASNKGNGGGLLAQIKSFNAFLERSALALEARMR